MLIRRELEGEQAVVHRVHDAAFARPGQVPAAEATLVDLLRRDADAWLPRLSLVAEVGGEVVGSVVCTRAWLRDSVPVLGLGPLGVLAGHRRRGIGTALVHAACAAADALDEAIVVLLGDPAFYARAGFVPAERLGISPPVLEWRPFFQVRSLAAYDPALHRGPFRYAPAFDLV